MTKWTISSLRSGIQVYPETEIHIHILLHIFLTENPINQSDSETEKTVDAMDDVNAYIEIIK